MKTLIRMFVVVLMLMLSGCYVRPMGVPYAGVGTPVSPYYNGYYNRGYYNNYYRPSYGSHYGYGFRRGGRWR